MADFFEQEINKAVDKEINRAVDNEVDKFLEPHLGEKQLKRMKRMVKQGRPLDADAERMLRKFMTDEQVDDYRKIHNAAAEAEKVDKDLRSLESDLNAIDKLFG